MLLGIIASFFSAWFFDHLGKLNLKAPVLDSLATFLILVFVKRRAMRHVWFWVTLAALLGLHVALLMAIPWTSKWVPAPVFAGFMAVDFCLMLIVITVVGNLVEGTPKGLSE